MSAGTPVIYSSTVATSACAGTEPPVAAASRAYAQKIAEQIESTYDFEPFPPAPGNLLVDEVEINGIRYQYVGKGTLQDYLFTINW
jgi:hypothetical protein